ncbi:MAG TPA: hypothetical protein VJW94_20145 [Candidatus Acidoferrum sp.]|nr:hypothetical protein [Candidatus Acidoferrum sp.]
MLDPVTRKRKVPKERRTCPARSHFAAFVTSCMVFSNCLNPSLEFGAKAWKNELSTQPDIPLATPIIRELLTYESFLLCLQDPWVAEILPQAKAIVSNTRSCRKAGFW